MVIGIIFIIKNKNELVNIAKKVKLISMFSRGTSSNGDWCEDLLINYFTFYTQNTLANDLQIKCFYQAN